MARTWWRWGRKNQLSAKDERTRARRRGSRWARLGVEELEDRTLLSSSFASALDGQLNALQSGINTALSAVQSVPIVGSQLGSNSTQAVNNFINGIQSNIDKIDNVLGSSNPTATVAQQLLTQALGPNGAGLLQGTVHVTDLGNGSFSAEAHLHADPLSVSQSMSFNTGLPGLPLNFQGNIGVTLGVGFDYQLAFKYDAAAPSVSLNTAYLDDFGATGPHHQLAVNVSASLPSDFNARLTLGFLYGSAKPVAGEANAFSGALYADNVTDPSAVKLSGDVGVQVNLQLNGGIGGDTSLSAQIPSVTAQFHLNWQYDTSDSSLNAPSVSFDHVGLDLGAFISHFLGPVIGNIEQVTKPFEDAIKVLRYPLPGISDLTNFLGQGDTTLETLFDYGLDAFGFEPVADFLDTASTVANTVNQFDFSNGALMFDLPGSFSIGTSSGSQGSGLTQPGLNPSDITFTGDTINAQQLITDAINQLKNVDSKAAAALQNFTQDVFNPVSIKYPIISDPAQVILGMLVGQNPDLVSVDLNTDASTGFNTPSGLSIFGLGVNYVGNATFSAHMHIGYDTFGIKELLQQVVNNQSVNVVSDITDGLYISAAPGAGAGNTILSLSGSLAAAAGVSIGFAGVSVQGGVYTGTPISGFTAGDLTSPITVTLTPSPSEDGKVRLGPDILTPILNGEKPELTAAGQLNAGLNVDLDIGFYTPFGFVGYQQPYTIAQRTLIDLSSAPPPAPVIAGLNPNDSSELDLYVGNQADLRQVVPQTGDESYSITTVQRLLGDGTQETDYAVSAFGITQYFLKDSIKKIVGTAADENLSVTLDSGVSAEADLDGGSGSAQFTYSGTGYASLRAGSKDSILKGGSGDNDLYAGAGSDTLYAGTGRTFFHYGTGPQTLFVAQANSGNPDVVAGTAPTNGKEILEVTGSFTGIQTITLSPFFGSGLGVAYQDGKGNTPFEVVGSGITDLLLAPTSGVQNVNLGDLTNTGLRNVQLSVQPNSAGFLPINVNVTATSPNEQFNVSGQQVADNTGKSLAIATQIQRSGSGGPTQTFDIYGLQANDNVNLIGAGGSNSFVVSPNALVPLNVNVQDSVAGANDALTVTGTPAQGGVAFAVPAGGTELVNVTHSSVSFDNIPPPPSAGTTSADEEFVPPSILASILASSSPIGTRYLQFLPPGILAAILSSSDPADAFRELLPNDGLNTLFNQNVVTFGSSVRTLEVDAAVTPITSDVQSLLSGTPSTTAPPVEIDVNDDLQTDKTTLVGGATSNTFNITTSTGPGSLVLDAGGAANTTFNVNYDADGNSNITVKDSGHTFLNGSTFTQTTNGDTNTLNVNDLKNTDPTGTASYAISNAAITRYDPIPQSTVSGGGFGGGGSSGGGSAGGQQGNTVIGSGSDVGGGGSAGSQPSDFYTTTISYSTLNFITVSGGPTGNTFTVTSTDPAAYTQIVPGSSQDSIDVTPNPYALNTVISSLFINYTANSGGPPSLILDDTGLTPFTTFNPLPGFSTETPQSTTYTISGGEVQRTTTYQEFDRNLQGVTVGGSNPTSTVDVRYASLSTLTVKDTAASLNANAFKVVNTNASGLTILALQRADDTVQAGDKVTAQTGVAGGAHDLEHINNLDVQGTPGSMLTVDDEAEQETYSVDGIRTHRVSTAPPTFTLGAGSVSFANQGTDTVTNPDGSVYSNYPFAVASTITYSNLGALVVQGSSQLSTGNVFNVLATNTPTTIKAGSNGDIVHAGDPQAGLDNIADTLTVTGAGNTSLVLDDTGKRNGTIVNRLGVRDRQTNSVSYVVNAGSVTRTNQIVDTFLDVAGNTFSSAPEPLVTNNFAFSGLAGLAIDGGPTGNHFIVPSTGPEQDTINAGTAVPGDPLNPGKDVVDVGGTPSGVLDAVGSLIVNGGTGTVVNLNDQDNQSSAYPGFGGTIATNPIYMITAGSVTRVNSVTAGGAPFGDYVTTVGYNNVSQLAINGGHSGNRFSVEGTAAGTQLTINDGSPIPGDSLNPGTNTVNVGSSSLNADSTLDPILGPVTVNGQGGADTLDVHDEGGTPGTAPGHAYNYAITNSTIGRTGTATITYNGIAAVNVFAANAGSTGFNALSVASTAAGTAYQLYAGTGENEFGLSDINDTLNGIQGSLALHGAVGSPSNDDIVFLTDVDTTAHHTFQVNAGASPQSGVVQRFNAAGQADMATVSYDGINAYAVLNTAGSIGATVNVQSQAPNLFTIIAAGTPDTVHVGNSSHTLGAIQGDLRIQGVLGQTPTIQVDDAADASAQPIDMGNDPSYGYLVNGLLPQSSTGYGKLWFLLDPAAPVSITTGARNFHLHDLTGAPAFTLNGGGSSLDTGTAGLAGNFDHTLSLADFSAVSLHVLGDWSGSLLAPTVGTPAAPVGPIVIDGSMTASGKIKVGALSSLTVGGDLAGTVNGYANSGSQGQPTIGTVTVGGNFTGTLTAPVIGSIIMTPTSTFSGTASETTPGADFQSLVLGTVTSTAVIDAGAIVSATVAGDMAGQINVSGPLATLAVAGTLSGSVTAQSLAGLSVTKDLTGQVSVTGLLGPVSVSGNSSGTIAAGQLTSVAAPNAHGPVVLDFTEGGVERRLLATPVDGSSLDAVSFSYSVDASGPGDPLLTVHVSNADPGHDRFDLSLTSSSAAAGFDLAHLDSPAGPSGIRDVAIDGNLLTGGISLPQDHLGSVAVWGQAATGAVRAGSVEAVAFGSVAETGRTVAATQAHAHDALELLDSQTGLAQADGSFLVPFGAAQPVALFLTTEEDTDKFNPHKVLFTDQINDGAPVTAQVTVTVPTTPGDDGSESRIQTISLQGDGGAINTSLPVYTAITSTGPLGDLILTAAGGLAANVTAPSIIGNIEVQGPIAGTIQTTGIRTDPITGSTSTIAADWGTITGGSTTVVQAQGGGITGRLISRGNFLSRIVTDAGISGVIAAQGNIGTTVGTTRLGGILSHGPLQGEIVTLGYLIGNVEIGGGLKGGRIAAKLGIPGNLLIHGSVDAISAIVSGGAIGDATAGTSLTVGNVQGIVAAEGPFNLASGNTKNAAFFQGNLAPGNSNTAVLDAIFTNNGAPLSFDVTGLDLAGLNLILTDLESLTVGPDGNLKGPKP